MIANPFTYGNPISDPKRFFGRSSEVEQIFSRLCNVEFESSSLVGERRVGKTSLLNYLCCRDIRPQKLTSDNYLFIYEDLQVLGKNTTPVQLWQRLLLQMKQSCKDPETKSEIEMACQSDLTDTYALTDLFNTLQKRNLYVVFLLDEFEHVTDNQNFDTDFFLYLRHLATRYHLSLITSSCRELADLCHSNVIRSSPFFNIFANIELKLFTENEARQLISTQLNETGVSFTEEDLNVICLIAGTHPYFVKIACYFLFEAYRNMYIDKYAYLGNEFEREATPHLEHYWRDSDDQEKIVLTLQAVLDHQTKIKGFTFNKDLMQNFYAYSSQTLRRLKKRSLLLSFEEDSYRLFSRSFSEWICKEITNTIHDRQSYEEWLSARAGTIDLTAKVKKEMGDILPRISSKYRELMISWVSDPNNLLIAVKLLRAMLSLG